LALEAGQVGLLVVINEPKSRVGKNHDFFEKNQKIRFFYLNQIFLFKSDHDLY